MPTIDIAATVQRCCAEYNSVLKAELAKGSLTCDGIDLCRDAYFRHVPFLIDRDHIRAFIACIAHGNILEIISSPTATRLLYSAQVALSALPREPRPARETPPRPTNPTTPTPNDSTQPPAAAQPPTTNEQPAKTPPPPSHQQPATKQRQPAPGKNTPTPSPSIPSTTEITALINATRPSTRLDPHRQKNTPPPHLLAASPTNFDYLTNPPNPNHP